MTRFKWLSLLVFLVALFGLTACGGGGGGNNDDGGPVPVSSLNFTIQTLSGFMEGAFGAGVAVNDAGLSVGIADNGTTLQAVSWDAATALPVPVGLTGLAGGGGYSAAYGINDSDVIVGEASDGTRPVAVFWPAGGTTASPLPLVGLFAGGTSAAYGINQVGEIVGEADSDLNGTTVAVYWAASTANPVVLENLAATPAAYSSAYAINDFQVVIGESLNSTGSKVPVVWVPDGAGGFNAPVALPLLPGHVEGVALDIDESDVVVGESMAADGTRHGVIWSIDVAGDVVTMQDFGVDTSLGAINNNQLVGGSAVANGDGDAAVIWSSSNILDSKQLTDAISGTFGLNDANWAVGSVNGSGFVAIPQ